MLTLKNLTVSVGDKKILSDIQFSFEKGKTYAIMGPNGSGKSTLAAAIMGHPGYQLAKKSSITFQNKSIINIEPHIRAQKGIFLSHQSPLTLSGVNVFQLLRVALQGKTDPLDLKNQIKKYCKDLKIKEELVWRSLNDGFSGGERKKMEMLQAAVLNPYLLILDEIDTGVDVDALKNIAHFINVLKNSDRTIVIITHYNRILKYVQPDEVIVVIHGSIAKVGDKTLAEKIEKNGYGEFQPK